MGRFVTTRWSLVLAAGRPDGPDGAAAMASLCEAYWFPVYAYIRRSGRSVDDAKDLTQAFFARMIERNVVGAADPERGRFRTFLLSSVKHFMANQHDADVALKRGGGATHLPLEFDDGERRYLHEPIEPDTPERQFQRRWAYMVLDAAMSRVAVQYARTDRFALFERLKSNLLGDEPASYDALSAELGQSPGAIRVAVHRLRRAYRDSLRAVIAETVERPEDIEDELRELMAAFAR